MEEARRRALQASRSAFLRKEADRQKKVSAAVLKERLQEIQQGLVPSSVTEADFLLQRAKEVSTADGLLRAARHRREMEASEETLADLEREAPSRPFTHGSVDDTTAAFAGGSVLPSPGVYEAVAHSNVKELTSSTPRSPGSGFVEMEQSVIEERIARKDYVPERTMEELEQEKVLTVTSKHMRLQKQRSSLPIFHVREKLLDTVRSHQVVVLVGETGSGKTTQILQYLYEEGLHLRTPGRTAEAKGTQATEGKEAVGPDDDEELRLVCTQPRRIAAVSVAERVAQEVGCRCGSVVGYKVRFDDCSGPLTKILYVTDGMMLKEFIADPDLSTVAAIMVDEAHERSLNTDILLGLLRDVIRRNPRLKVIVASATINAKKFSRFFNGAPVFTVTGRTFPVEVFFAAEPIADYVTESAQTVVGLHMEKALPGDILVFLPGQDAIEACAETIRQYVAEAAGRLRPLLILPVYSSLPPKEQARIYEPTPPGTRKVVIATNIAETSITIDGMVYVVDCGLCKQDYYNPKTMVEELRVVPTSQASATQRAGRAGRTKPGECFRLYTCHTFQNELPPETVPEIMRSSMSSVVLQLKALGITNLLKFDFIDAPSTESLERALDHLYLLGAMKADGRLTVTGRRMAEFPLDPSLSKCLIRACALGCGRHMAMAAAMLTLDSVFLNTRDAKVKQHVESAKDQLFSFGNGDVAGYVRILEDWLRAGPQAIEFCKAYGVNEKSMLRARDTLDQILAILDRIGLSTTNGKDGDDATAANYVIDSELLTRALLSGFFFNVAKLEVDKRTYSIVRPMDTGAAGPRLITAAGGSLADEAPIAEIHPTSYLFRAGSSTKPTQSGPGPGPGGIAPESGSVAPVLKEKPSLVVFTQLRHTTKRYMMHVSAIPSPDMAMETAPVNYFQREELTMGLRKRPRG